MADSDKVAKALESRLLNFRYTLTEATELRSRGLMTQRSLDAISESTFSSSYAAFEQFLEDSFFATLLGKTSVVGAAGVVDYGTRARAELLIVEPGRFLRWLPWDLGMMANADRFLEDGLPFSRLVRHDQEKRLLDESRHLRNAVAHASTSAKKKASTYTAMMPVRRRTVAGYLQSPIQGTTRHGLLVDNFRAIARAIAEPTTARAKAFLSPENPYLQGDIPSRGRYECESCHLQISLTLASSPLPACPTCSSGGKSKWRRIW